VYSAGFGTQEFALRLPIALASAGRAAVDHLLIMPSTPIGGLSQSESTLQSTARCLTIRTMKLRLLLLPLIGLAVYLLLRHANAPDRVGLTRRSSHSEDRQRQIAEAAYYRAELRGFTPGFDLADWFAAERDLSMPRRGQVDRCDH